MDGFEDVSAVLGSGVYALRYQGKVVFIGKAKSCLPIIAAHRANRGRSQPSWLPIRGITFDEVLIRPTRTEDLDQVYDIMVKRYRPRYNVAVTPPVLEPVRRL